VNTQERIDVWAGIVTFLGGHWVRAMAADDSAGEELPDEFARAIADVGEAFRRAIALAQKYRSQDE
jgi:hypothetical protein